MPLTLADAVRLSGNHTAETAGDHGAPPTPRITMEGFRAIDLVVTPTCQWIMGIGQAPLVPNPSSQLRGDCDRILKRYADNHLKNSHKAPTSRFNSAPAADESLLRGFERPESTTADATRPFVRIMFDPDVDALGFAYVKEVAEGMMRSGVRDDHFKVQVWLGFREWRSASITAWGRAKTLLAAREFDAWVRVENAKHKRMLAARAALAAQGGQASNSLAHFASLTSRQARRSGVEEQELRERWA